MSHDQEHAIERCAIGKNPWDHGVPGTEGDPLFKVIEVHEFRFGPEAGESRPRAWSMPMERKPD